MVLMILHLATLGIGAALLGQVHTIDDMCRKHGNPVLNYTQHHDRE